MKTPRVRTVAIKNHTKDDIINLLLNSTKKTDLGLDVNNTRIQQFNEQFS